LAIASDVKVYDDVPHFCLDDAADMADFLAANVINQK
ncbi:MAG: hypothetical protein K0R22_2637, partial [Sporomusa sp.]|nr:hypothetical protein [Sporomusa sp.]